jgi:hypothetical protein
MLDIVQDTNPDFPEYAYLIHTLPMVLNAHVVVETGLGRGDSTRLLLAGLSSLSNPEQRTLHTFEMYMDQPYGRSKPETVKLIQDYKFPAKWELHVQDSTSVQWNPDVKIDLLFLDADHGYENVTKELNCFGLHLSNKAVILSDDSWNPNSGGDQPPYNAMRDWASRNGPRWKHIQFRGHKGLSMLFAEREHNFGR